MFYFELFLLYTIILYLNYNLKRYKAELAFCRDITSREKIPIPRIKKPCDIPKIKIPTTPKYRRFCINPGDLAKIPGVKIPKLRRIRGIFSELRKPDSDPWDFRIVRSGPK